MKKVAVVFLALALLMLFSVVPAMAKTEKVPVNMNYVIASYDYGTRYWWPNEFIQQERGSTLTFDILDLDIGGSPHTGVWISTLDVKANFRTGTWVGCFDTVFALDGSTDNGFAGNIQIVQYLYDGEYKAHGVLQGFGVYEKQTLFFTYDGPRLDPEQWTGYCLKG